MSRIFQPREQVKRQQATNDVAGRFRSGYQINNRPASLPEWRVTTVDHDVAARVIELLGASHDEPQEWETKGDDVYEVFTKAKKVDVILNGISAIDARMVVWTRGADRLFVCGGKVYEPEKSEPYVCEDGDYTTKAEHDEQGHVCEPLIKVRFRLADDPDLGLFEFQTGAWSLASVIGNVLYDLQAVEGPALASLALEPTEFTREGQKVKFTKPVISIKGAAPEEG